MPDFRPISTYVMKIASRCNLNCSYCYMYNLQDKTYKDQPSVMCKEVVLATLEKSRAHALEHGTKVVNYIFHGGEPLLAGEEFFRHFVRNAKEILGDQIAARFSMQTNATLLTEKWMDLFVELDIRIGISLDGTKEFNDANRVDHQGNGSYDKVVSAINMMNSNPKYRKMLGGLLTVINLDSQPLEIYRHFRTLGAKGADFRLPDATYDNPPPAKMSPEHTPFADWMLPIFDEWFADPDDSFKVRMFENIIGLVFGATNSTEDIGGRKTEFVVIETNGGIEPPGALKACEEGLTKVGLNILTHEMKDVYEVPLFATFLSGQERLCQTCQKCPIVSVCGGGKLAHRFSSKNGFDNPSVYCADLMKLVTHVQEKTIASLPQEFREKLKLGTLKQILETEQNQALTVS